MDPRSGFAETKRHGQRTFLQHDRLSTADVRTKPYANRRPSLDHRAPPGWTGVAQIEVPNAETRRRGSRRRNRCRRRETDDEVDRRPTIRGQRLGPPIRHRDLEPFTGCRVKAPAPRVWRRRPAGHRPHRQTDTRQLELLQTRCVPIAKPAVGRRNNSKSHGVKHMPRLNASGRSSRRVLPRISLRLCGLGVQRDLFT